MEEVEDGRRWWMDENAQRGSGRGLERESGRSTKRSEEQRRDSRQQPDTLTRIVQQPRTLETERGWCGSKLGLARRRGVVRDSELRRGEEA